MPDIVYKYKQDRKCLHKFSVF